MRVRGQQVLASVANPESASTEYRQALGTSRTNKRKCPLMPPADATPLNPDHLRDMLLGMLAETEYVCHCPLQLIILCYIKSSWQELRKWKSMRTGEAA